MTPHPPWPPITMTTTQNGSITITIAGAPHTHIPPGPRARYDAVKTVANLAKLLNRPHLTATAIDNTHTYTLNIYQNGTATDITHTTTSTANTTATAGTTGSAGTDGRAGTAGRSGSAGTDGTAGSDSTDGAAGNTGSVGFSGPGVIDTAQTRGVDGVSDAFGFTGGSDTDSTAGMTGEAGTAGMTGEAGLAGTAGRSGSAGTDGTAGSDSTDGTAGVVGGVSVTGADGFSGVDAFNALFAQVRMSEPLSDESTMSDTAPTQEVEEVQDFPASSVLLHGLQADSFLTQAFRPPSAGPGGTRAGSGEFGQDAAESQVSWLHDLTPQSSSSVSSLVSVLDHTGSDDSGAQETTPSADVQHVSQAVLQGKEEEECVEDGQARVTQIFPTRFKVQEEAVQSGKAEKEADIPGGSVARGEIVSWGKRALRSLLVAFATMIVFTAGLAVGVALSMYTASVNAPVFHTAPNSAEEHGQSGTKNARSVDPAQSSQSSQSGREPKEREGGDVDPKADEEKTVEETPTSTPTPTPNAPAPTSSSAPPAAAPAPAAPPAPPASSAPEPAPVGVTSLATSVSSHGGGAATLTVHVQGAGTIPVTVTIGAVSSTVNVNAPGSASLTLTPGPGRHTWTSNASGVTNTGSLTVY